MNDDRKYVVEKNNNYKQKTTNNTEQYANKISQ